MPINTIEEFEKIAQILIAPSKGVKAEVLLVELLENGILEDNLLQVEYLGLFKRGYREEIGKVEVLRHEDSEIPESLRVALWREGLYDTLPKALFHNKKVEQLKRGRDYKKAAEVNQKEQRAARDFFSPLDQAFLQMKLNIERKERQLLQSFSTRAKLEEMALNFWGFELGDIPLKYAIPLLHFLPYAHSFKGKIKYLEPLLSVLLNAKVKIRKEKSPAIKVADLGFEQKGLGECYLTCDFILGNTFEVDVPQLLVVLYGLNAEHAAKFVEGQYMHHLLLILLRFLFHADVDWQLEIDLSKQKETFILSDAASSEQGGYNNYLGYTSYLS